MATLSVCVGCKDLLFFLKMKDECLTVPYIYVPSKTSRDFENAFFFFSDGEGNFYITILRSSGL